MSVKNLEVLSCLLFEFTKISFFLNLYYINGILNSQNKLAFD